jgi:hypothetical protein
VEADAKRLNPEQAAGEAAASGDAAKDGLSICEDAIQKMRSGKELPAEEIKKCSAAFAQYYEDLSKKYETENNTDFPDTVRVEFYINAVKMAMINPSEHGGWPTVSPLRMEALSGLKKRIEDKNEAFAILGAIIPSLDSGDQGYAAEAMNKLSKNDPFLSQQAGKWIAAFRIRNEEDIKKYEAFIKTTGVEMTPKKKAETRSNLKNEE